SLLEADHPANGVLIPCLITCGIDSVPAPGIHKRQSNCDRCSRGALVVESHAINTWIVKNLAGKLFREVRGADPVHTKSRWMLQVPATICAINGRVFLCRLDV